MRSVLFLLLIFVSFGFTMPALEPIYLLQNGSVNFTSDAPLELIKAESVALKGVIDPTARTFAFSIPVNSFHGFNSPLQREHFNENYLESDKFAEATFFGKIIEKTDLNVDGEYVIRAKGKLKIHGVQRERIIKSTVVVNNGRLSINSAFSVLLREHDIAIPRIVYQKIAEEIEITITGEFESLER